MRGKCLPSLCPPGMSGLPGGAEIPEQLCSFFYGSSVCRRIWNPDLNSSLSGKFHGTGRIHPPDSAGIPYQAALLPRALQAFDGGAFSPSFQKSCPKGGKGSTRRPRSLRKSFSASALPCSPRAVRRTGVWNGSAGRAVFPRVSFLPTTNVSLRTAPRRSFCRPGWRRPEPFSVMKRSRFSRRPDSAVLPICSIFPDISKPGITAPRGNIKSVFGKRELTEFLPYYNRVKRKPFSRLSDLCKISENRRIIRRLHT